LKEFVFAKLEVVVERSPRLLVVGVVNGAIEQELQRDSRDYLSISLYELLLEGGSFLEG